MLQPSRFLKKMDTGASTLAITAYSHTNYEVIKRVVGIDK